MYVNATENAPVALFSEISFYGAPRKKIVNYFSGTYSAAAYR